MNNRCSIARGEARHFHITDPDDGHHTLVRNTGVLVHFWGICYLNVEKVTGRDKKSLLTSS
jgi:hypothetical protein